MFSIKYSFINYSIIVLLVLLNKCHGFDFPCVTWDNYAGLCIDKSTCPGFEQALSQKEKVVTDLWIHSPCRDYNENYICCGYADGKLYFTFNPKEDNLKPNIVTPSTTTTTTPTSRQDITLLKEVMEQYQNRLSDNSLPGILRCGKQQADNRITYGNCTCEARVWPDEFTWLVHVIPDEEAQLLCTGILINTNTILTSYNCGSKATKARLGVFRLNETQTCVRTSQIDDDMDCKAIEERDVEFIPNPEVPELGILKIKPSVLYNGTFHNSKCYICVNCIPLIEYIRTICLPFEELVRPTVDQDMFVLGWHLIEDEGSKVAKHKLIYRVVEDEQCVEAAVNSTSDGRMTFCIKQVHNFPVSSSFNIAEGPIIYKQHSNWYLAGFRWQTIESKSKEANDTRILGATITRTDTLKWILDNLKNSIS